MMLKVVVATATKAMKRPPPPHQTVRATKGGVRGRLAKSTSTAGYRGKILPSGKAESDRSARLAADIAGRVGLEKLPFPYIVLLSPYVARSGSLSLGSVSQGRYDVRLASERKFDTCFQKTLIAGRLWAIAARLIPRAPSIIISPTASNVMVFVLRT